MSNKIVFASNINIGQNGAENDDEFLFSCFIDHHALSELRDIKNPSNFVLGSTGSGKTALLRMIDKLENNCRQFEVHEMAMNHIANSDTVRFMSSIDVDLSIFFQTLWKHVLCIEYIKLIANTESQDKFRYFKDRLIDFIKGEDRRERFSKFVTENEHQFWNTVDENIIEITDALETDVRGSLGAEVDKFKTNAGYTRTLSAEKKSQFQQRAKKFVDGKTIAALGHIISELSNYAQGRMEKYYILIDRLDEPWVDESIKYQLIQALFEALKGLHKLRNFKVVVALRNDVYEKMIREAPPSQAQLEKYNDYIVRLKWSKDQLRQLAEKRINHLFKWKYSSENVYFDQIFKQRIDSRDSVWNYLVDRTLMRPRDVINLINEALQQSEGRSAVSKTDFLKGEHRYSDLRLEALRYEWQNTYPSIGVLLELLREKPAYFGVSEYATSKTVELVFEKIGATSELQKDSMWRRLEGTINNGSLLEPIELCQEIFSRLHLVGAVGLKVQANSPWQWIYETGKPVSQHQISLDTKVKIHPMLEFALGTSNRSIS